MPPPERRPHLRGLPGRGQPIEGEPHRIENVPAFLDQLHALRIGLPITFQPQTGERVRLGHFAPIDHNTDLVIMSDGLMQLRQTEHSGDMYPLSRLATMHYMPHIQTANEARDHFLRFQRNAAAETIIEDAEPEHNRSFADALTHVHGLIEQRRLAMDHTRELLGAIVPTDAAELTARSDALNAETAATIDELAKEKLGKAIMLRDEGKDPELIGYAMPAPVEGAGPNRYLFLFKTGNIYGIEISEGSQEAEQFASRNATEVTVPDYGFLGSDAYLAVTSNTTIGDPDLLEGHYTAAGNWLDDKRAERRQHVATEHPTRRMLTKVREGVTEQTIEDHAREILGQDFLGEEAVKNVEAYLKSNGVNISFDLSELPPIPYSETDLRLAKEHGEMLVLRPAGVLGNLGVVEPITLQGLATYFKSGPKRIFHESSYGVEYAFAHKTDDIKFGWALVGKTPLQETLGYKFGIQEQDLLEYGQKLRRKGADRTNITRRTATEVAWDLALYECNTDEILLQNLYDATSSVHSKNVVIVGGNARGHGLNTNGMAANNAFGNVGVCTVR